MQGKKNFWTKERDQLLIENYKPIGAEATSKLLGVCLKTIYSRASTLGLTQKMQELSNQEQDYIAYRQRINILKRQATTGRLRGHKVISILNDKVVLEIKTRDSTTYKECYTFSELALAKQNIITKIKSI